MTTTTNPLIFEFFDGRKLRREDALMLTYRFDSMLDDAVRFQMEMLFPAHLEPPKDEKGEPLPETDEQKADRQKRDAEIYRTHSKCTLEFVNTVKDVFGLHPWDGDTGTGLTMPQMLGVYFNWRIWSEAIKKNFASQVPSQPSTAGKKKHRQRKN